MLKRPRKTPKLRDPSVYADAQELIAAGIVRKAWNYVVGVLLIVVGGLGLLGYDLNKKRSDLSTKIEEFEQEIDTLKKDAEQEIDKSKKDAEQEIDTLKKDTRQIVSNAEKELRSLEKELRSQTDQQDRLKERLNYLDSLIETARALPNEYINTITNQSKAFGEFTAETNRQLETSKAKLANISSADSALDEKGELIDSKLLELEKLEAKLKQLEDKLDKKLDQRLVPLESKVLDRWDEVFWTKEKNKTILDLGLKLSFGIEDENLLITNVQLRDNVTNELLCDNFTLVHKNFIYVRTQEDVLFRMTNRYLIDTPGMQGSIVGLRFEKLNSEPESEQTCSPST